MDKAEVAMLVGALDAARVRGICEAQGLSIRAWADVDALDTEHAQLAIVSPEALASVGGQDLARLRRRLGSCPVVFLCGSFVQDQVSEFIGFEQTVAIVAREHVTADDALAQALTVVNGAPRFGLEALVRDVDALDAITVAGSHEVLEALAWLEDFLQRRGIRRRLVARLKDASEELLTNAVYNAPVDDSGRALYARWDRRRAVSLDAEQRPNLLVAHGARLAAVAISDPFGSLSVATVRAYLSRGLSAGSDQIGRQEGGAGLGLTRVYRCVDHMTVSVARGRRTQVAVVLETEGARRTAGARPGGLLLVEA